MNIRKFSGALAGAHVNFFTHDTYRLTAQYAGWEVKEISAYFFDSNILNRVTARFVPHLYLVAKNDADYRYGDKKIREWQDDVHYDDMITIMNKK